MLYVTNWDQLQKPPEIRGGNIIQFHLIELIEYSYQREKKIKSISF